MKLERNKEDCLQKHDINSILNVLCVVSVSVRSYKLLFKATQSPVTYYSSRCKLILHIQKTSHKRNNEQKYQEGKRTISSNEKLGTAELKVSCFFVFHAMSPKSFGQRVKNTFC